MSKWMKHIALLLLTALALPGLSGCFETPEPEDLPDRLLVQAYLWSGAPAWDITLQYVNPATGAQRAASGLQVNLTQGTTTILLEEEVAGSGRYEDRQGQWIIEPGLVYDLLIVDGENRYYASTQVPYPANEYAINSEAFSVGDSSEVLPSYIEVDWFDANAGQRPGWYKAAISPVEQDTLVPIAPAKQLLDSQAVYTLIYEEPVQESSLFIFPGLVEYYGAHKLTITAYQSAYINFADAEPGTIINLGSDAPGNIVNGLGIFSGFTRSEIIFFVED